MRSVSSRKPIGARVAACGVIGTRLFVKVEHDWIDRETCSQRESECSTRFEFGDWYWLQIVRCAGMATAKGAGEDVKYDHGVCGGICSGHHDFGTVLHGCSLREVAL
jgi:hypothetical protein